MNKAKHGGTFASVEKTAAAIQLSIEGECDIEWATW